MREPTMRQRSDDCGVWREDRSVTICLGHGAVDWFSSSASFQCDGIGGQRPGP